MKNKQKLKNSPNCIIHPRPAHLIICKLYSKNVVRIIFKKIQSEQTINILDEAPFASVLTLVARFLPASALLFSTLFHPRPSLCPKTWNKENLLRKGDFELCWQDQVLELLEEELKWMEISLARNLKLARQKNKFTVFLNERVLYLPTVQLGLTGLCKWHEGLFQTRCNFSLKSLPCKTTITKTLRRDT